MDLRLNHPSNALLAGPSKSGKSILLSNLLFYNKTLFKTSPRSIILVYKRDQPIYDKLKKHNIVNHFININKDGIDSVSELLDEYKTTNSNGERGSFLILDDLIGHIDESFETLFTVDGHHKNASIFITSQKLHTDSKSYKIISANCDYVFLMKNPRNSAINHFANQISPEDPKLAVFAYKKATKRRFGYLLYDGSQDIDDKFRFRTNIFPFEEPMKIFFNGNNE